MLNKLIEILISAALLLPVFAVLHRVRFRDRRKTVHYFVFAVYLAAVYLFVGLPTAVFVRFEWSVTLMPFLPMLADFRNTCLNVLLFVPLGMLLPFLWEKYRPLKRTLFFGVAMTLSIELLQIFTYRATDINDVIANTLGTLLGHGLFSLLSRYIPAVGKFAETKNEAFTVLLAVCGVMFFAQPLVANLYYAIT